MFTDIKNFYPTPPQLIEKMLSMVKGSPKKILEPSAGKGDLIAGLKDFKKYYERKDRFGKPYKDYHRPFEHHADISCIEINPTLQATLRGNHYTLIDSDFLAYTGPDKFDLILMNPPFDDGDKHLMKAIEIMYRGQIVCLLNAETIRNPHTNTRKALARKLKELKATVKFYKNGFLDAERKTKVEVAIVYINIERKVEDDLFAGAKDRATRAYQSVKGKNEVSTGRTIEELVAEYDEIVRIGTETIVNYYRNYNKVGKYLEMFDANDKQHYHRSDQDLTTQLQNAVNQLLVSVRTDFWRRTLKLEEVQKRMTEKKQNEFEEQLKQYCFMDFTAANIRQFVLNLIGSYEQTMTDAVVEIFDMFTIRYAWDEELRTDNIHYFNGWKTNKAYKVGKRVVIPIPGSYGGPFQNWGKWDLDYKAARRLQDIDTVMNYFDGMDGYVSMSSALTQAFAKSPSADRMSGIESTYFRITCHKKGTIHLTFKNMDVLRRFNVVACKAKNMLPHDYGTKKYASMNVEEQAVVNAFEDKRADYDKAVAKPLFAHKSLPQIGFKKAA